MSKFDICFEEKTNPFNLKNACEQAKLLFKSLNSEIVKIEKGHSNISFSSSLCFAYVDITVAEQLISNNNMTRGIAGFISAIIVLNAGIYDRCFI